MWIQKNVKKIWDTSLIHFKEQDLIAEQSFKQRILKEKDNVMKDIEKMHKDLSFAIKEKVVVEKESKKMVDTTRVRYIDR